MNLKQLKDLVGRVEDLGLNTDPLRLLIQLIYSQEVQLHPYIEVLTVISSFIDLELPREKKGEHVQALMLELSRLITTRDVSKAQTGNSASSQLGNPALTLEILTALKDIKNSIGGLSVIKPDIDTSSSSPDLEIEKVFVNPLGFTEELKANVSIDAISGGNISEKIKKLKTLKKGS